MDNIGQNLPFALMIILSQIIGAFLGCLSSFLAQYEPEGKNKLQPGIATLKPFGTTIEQGGLQAFYSETILTAFFVSVILTAKYLNGANDLFLNALVIGLTLFTAVTVGGGISGGCYNPAVGIAQIPYQNFAFNYVGESDKISWKFYWVYPIATALGGVFAGIFLKINTAA